MANTSPPEPSPANSADLHWDDNGQPISGRFNDIYFSKENGLEESRYVFLESNQLAQRFSQLKSDSHFCIAETGFGTGLNFLNCWQLWLDQAPANARLSYISVEKYPLKPDELQRALALWPQLNELSQTLCQQYRGSFCADKALRTAPWLNLNFGPVRLIVIFDDAVNAFEQLQGSEADTGLASNWRGIDAWFLDGFAPAQNPEMWSPTLFKRIQQLSHSSTTLATFTAAGQVRRGLQEHGFTIEKIPGYGRKREMIIGHFQGQKSTCPKPTTALPSQNQNQASTMPQHVAIIGAGLSGCHSAYALAKRGIKVTLIDAASAPANGASGNPQGIIYAKLSAHAQMLNDFNLHALLYAQQHYRHYWADMGNKHDSKQVGEACGVLQLSLTERLQQQHRQIAEQCQYGDFVRYVDAKAASALAGIDLAYPALFFPDCGWLAPPQLCQWLLEQYPLNQHYQTRITQLQSSEQGWHLFGEENTADKGRTTPWQLHCDAVIIANANDAKLLAQSQWLPTKAIRGQITTLNSDELAPLQSVICGESYIAPATVAGHTVGASYALQRQDKEICEQEHKDNLQNLDTLVSLAQPPSISSGRVSFRCTSPDYLPFVGPAPDYKAFIEHYDELRFNSKAVIPGAAPYHKGLYLNLAHGSRGLSYTPIAAEVLASLICGEPVPLAQSLIAALNPARFILRDLKRKLL